MSFPIQFAIDNDVHGTCEIECRTADEWELIGIRLVDYGERGGLWLHPGLYAVRYKVLGLPAIVTVVE